MKNGALVISLDFELLWGVFDVVNWKEKKKYFRDTREVIPQILQLFEQYEISCTWATVGMLFNYDWEEWNANIPRVLPEYSNKALSAYVFGKGIQFKETESLCFAPDLILKIRNTPRQEIGTHTYSHYYCQEKGQDFSSFEADIKQSKLMAEKLGIEMKSLVFPRNQFNKKYLEICKKTGIENVRSNPSNWYWKDTESSSLINKIFRTGDAYLGVTDKSYPLADIYEIQNELLIQKASRMLRPFTNNKTLNSFKLKRIKDEMTKAAKSDEIYHLWWHPHNFGDFPTESLKDLENLLVHFEYLNKEFGFVSLNMCETEKLAIQ